MSGFRLDRGGDIDRGRPVRFHFDGVAVQGFEGDTLASALIASGIRVVGRSFKYHRPRGIWGFGVEEPNALFDVLPIGGATRRTNTRATTEPARDGLAVRSVNTYPSAARDRFAILDWFSRFVPAGFYYKTFMVPNWKLFEPRIREMAGLGRIDEAAPDGPAGDQIHEVCDVLVVGGGPAGLLAALGAAEAGRSVIVCDEGEAFGGACLHRGGTIDGEPARAWVAATLAKLSALGARCLTRTTAFGLYDHKLAGLIERRDADLGDRLWRVRPDKIVIAAGAIERPLPFSNNDRPGVMSAEAALAYLERHAVAVGRRVIVATNNDRAHAVARAYAAHGIAVTVVDQRPGAVAVGDGFKLIAGRRVVDVAGRTGVSGVTLDDGEKLDADAVLVSGGFSPTVHLYCQAKGKLAWDAAKLALVPGTPVADMKVVGAAAGHFTLAEALDDVAAALADWGIAPKTVPAIADAETRYTIEPAWPEPSDAKGRVFIDFQDDVTAKDVALAHRENYVSVEHLKRYTTLGMATDQGKTSNLPGLALMAKLAGKAIPEVGTTTYRPPFAPVPLATLAGVGTGDLMNPARRLVIEDEHRALGAAFLEYGGWVRPAWYGPDDSAIEREAKAAREGVALFDGSTLGKIEVAGPDAAAFLDFIYYNTMSTLKPGRCRYGFMLTEAGVVYDDGVLVRLDEDRFIVSCSSSHVAGVHAHLEEWRQDRFDRRRIVIHNTTAAHATLTVSGPKARALLDAVGLGLDLSDAALPHMATAPGSFEGTPVRVTRVSFTGDRSYELSIRADRAQALWRKLRAEGAAFGAVPIGLEALMILRAEKGYIVIGKDTDGLTRPMDLGVTQPLAKKKVDFVGRRSLGQEEAQRPDRRQLVGLTVADGDTPLPAGAHGIERQGGTKRSIGFVTSSYASPALGRPIALGLIERGLARMGETIEIQHLGAIRRAVIGPACAFDPEGTRLDG